ncbi:MAG: hypothetical protein L3K17_03400 [Thermoplasmata archaeon]|nr:hypothetical protein [Thermoplasmata archaeon]
MSLFDPVWTLFRGSKARPDPNATNGAAEENPVPPLIAEVRHDLVVGAYDEAVRRAYLGALDDARRAYSLSFPVGWTHPEILSHGFPASTGDLPDSFRRLYDLYRPIRYGPPQSHRTPEPVIELLQDIYGRVPMWTLYRDPQPRADGAGPSAEAPEETYSEDVDLS